VGKYLFLYLKTGGGHLAPAKAVAEKIMAKRKGNAEIFLYDGLSESKPIARRIIEDGYKNAVNKAVWTFELLYALHKIRLISKITSTIVSGHLKPGLEKQVLALLPKKIVIFHFFLIKPVFEIIEKYNLDIPVLTVVTDPFTAHPIWFLQKNQNFIVFSEMLKEKCIRKGISEEKLKVFPFVLDRKFSQKISDSRSLIIRNSLGFEPDSKVILIMGGGDGMPKGKKILKRLITRNMNAEIAIVCGKNKKFYEHVMKLKNKYDIRNIKVYGYIDFVHSLIKISDVVITKCGASTFMEILLMGKVPLINNYIWEQEKGNMEFVCKSNMGILEKDTRKIPEVLNRLLNDHDFYNSLRNNIKNASFSNGVGQVSEYILKFNS
jgi:processive 1,2-diacylglycerol beta-glucosyltransferase/1,2-diacylglycerol 3-beta-galactosyltransferase